MYVIKFRSSRVKKDFKELIKKISLKKKNTLRDTLENNPYPSATHGNILNKIEQKRDLFCYELTGGDRILFLVLESPEKYVLIIFAGNHDDEIRFLKKRSK
jgi:hypothetical protein